MESCKNLNRLAWIDIAKGIGIILVVLGHAFRDEMREQSFIADYIFNLIYSFHMPLFFAISGITFGLSFLKYKNSSKTFYMNKTNSLFKPLISYSIIIYICFSLLYRIPYFERMLNAANYQSYSVLEYLKLQFLYMNPYSVHLWFIWVLFCVTIIAFSLVAIFRFSNKYMYPLIVVSIALYISTLFVEFPEAIKLLSSNMIFFVAGIFISEKKFALKPKLFFIIPIYIVSWGFLLLNLAKIIIIPYSINRLILTILTFPIIHSILMLSKSISSSKILEYIGRKSFAIYLFHQPFCCGFVGVLLYNKMHFPALFVYITCTVLSFIIPLLIILVSHKVKFIGKLTSLLFNI